MLGSSVGVTTVRAVAADPAKSSQRKSQDLLEACYRKLAPKCLNIKGVTRRMLEGCLRKMTPKCLEAGQKSAPPSSSSTSSLAPSSSTTLSTKKQKTFGVKPELETEKQKKQVD